MNPNFVLFLALFPLVAFVFSLLIPSREEKFISYYSIFVLGVHLITTHLVSLLWLIGTEETIPYVGPLIYSTDNVDFYFSFMYDLITAMFSVVGSILAFLVLVYSRVYLHREKGYKRFFNTILLFYAGYMMVILSGNFEMLFAGWEILGISSFLLISFYRERYLPVKNAFKVFSIYRLGDVGFVLAAWLCHLLWHHNIQFTELTHLASEHISLISATLLGCLFLLSAAAKSAQFPFCSWLPRAMEGPTPSSAIFYGSLSIHMGVFILLRTRPMWQLSPYVPVLMFVGGIITALICNGTARVQSAIKSQIAYSSLTQIGLMFVELSLGLDFIALLHFAGNAFLRTYQLLVSPSIVSYLMREQAYSTFERNNFLERWFPRPLAKGLYVLCIKEWNGDYLLESLLWRPLKKAGNFLHIMLTPFGITTLLLVSAGLFTYMNMVKDSVDNVPHILSLLLAFFGLLMVLLSFSERTHARTAWTLIFANHVWITAAVSISDKLSWTEIMVYLSGATISWGAGTLLLMYLKTKEKALSLKAFQGHVYEHPKVAFWFLICSLGLSGFPITPTFIGEDVIFHHIHENQFGVALCAALSYIIDGLSIIRIYSRVFMGPHIKITHEVSNRSA